jgi:hypothetical protein
MLACNKRRPNIGNYEFLYPPNCEIESKYCSITQESNCHDSLRL